MINNVLLAISMNVPMLSGQDIRDHIAKYISILKSWHSKKYAFEFVECVNEVVQREIISDQCNISYHILITDDSTDILVNKMLILYIKF